ncbi:DUF2304 domain-containing protein [Leucobacter albus]|uniref:DUF2304 domain-containing protein n=1 Tax=Leucobacter albus TaxID=272210 RepID=A0ABW3TPR6_9MICO
MFTPSHVISAVAAGIVLIVVLEMLRRGSLRERHALWWLFAGTIGLVVTLFPGLLDRIARLLGVENPLNLAFFGGIVVLFLVNMQQAKELTRLEARTRTLAEQVALLDDRLAPNTQSDNDPSRS